MIALAIDGLAPANIVFAVALDGELQRIPPSFKSGPRSSENVDRLVWFAAGAGFWLRVTEAYNTLVAKHGRPGEIIFARPGHFALMIL